MVTLQLIWRLITSCHSYTRCADLTKYLWEERHGLAGFIACMSRWRCREEAEAEVHNLEPQRHAVG